MSILLQIEDLTKSYGDRMLFDSVTFGINEGDKIGVVAKNGTGKSTMLRIIAGKEDADSGKVIARNDLRVGYLPQKPTFDGNPTVAQVVSAAAAEHRNPDDWDYEERLKRILTQLKITNLDARVDTLSGGMLKRVAIALVIIREPELIILDEPTNHLDIEIIEWLESYLKRSRVAILMVTHDRYFLDRVCNNIIELDNRQIYIYNGNYDYYLRRRAERIEAMTAELDKVRNTLRREQEWMSRQPQARAGKAKFRIDQFYELKDKERNGIRRERDVSLDVSSSYIGSKIFEAIHIHKQFGDKKIVDDFSYVFARYEKVGIIGVNGVGKSTFIKMLQGLEPTDAGSFDIGTTVRFGYYSQDGISFDSRKRVVDAVTEIAEEIDTGDVRLTPMQFLSRFLFTPADQQKYIHTLSGGELCRLHLATVLMRRPNFLILDEPTNDLDIVTLGILEEYLSKFNGCLIVISHDRYFLDNIVDHLFVMEGDGVIRDFPGTYSEYAEAKAAERVAKEPAVKAAPKRPKAERPPKMTFKEKKEFEALTEEIDALNAEKAELESKFNSGETLQDAAALASRYSEISEILDEKELRWLELSEKA